MLVLLITDKFIIKYLSDGIIIQFYVRSVNSDDIGR